MAMSYSIELACGCLIAEIETDGWEGCLDCGADYYTDKDLKKPHLKEHKDLHDKCWKEYIDDLDGQK